MPISVSNRLDGLDTLRGFAALTVFFNHVVILSPDFWPISQLKGPHATWVNWMVFSPLHLFWNGYEAVILFFVLSGFVLYFSYGATRNEGYASFATKRFLRIYPAFAGAMILTGLLMAETPHKHFGDLSSWFNQTVWAGFDWNSYLRNLALVDKFNTEQYDPVIWTLRIEMLLSFLFPIVFWMSNRRRWPFYLALIVFLSWVGYRFWLGGLIFFLPMFLVGALAARYKEGIANFIRSKSRGNFTVFVLCGLVLYLSRVQGSTPATRPVTRVFFDECIAFGALILILAVASGRMDRLFLWRPAVFFGKRSYSFYLLHIPILFSSIRVLHPYLEMPVIVVLSLAFSVLAAMLSYEWVEKPSIRAGHWCAHRIARFKRA